jgi:hypothetical protein
MRRQILGYLLGGLDDDEIERLKQQLSKNRQLEQELERIREAVDPLTEDQALHLPPEGLAAETCEHVALRRATGDAAGKPPSLAGAIPLEQPTGSQNSRWNFVDIAVVAGILAAMALLLIPLVNQSRFQAQKTACQDNLAELGRAFQAYGKNNHGIIPQITGPRQLAVAGIYAPRLLEAGLISNPRVVLCTGSELGQSETPLNIPTYGQLVKMAAEDKSQLEKLLPRIGGSYAYHLGYREGGNYRTVSLHRQGKTTTILLADSPSADYRGTQSGNHAGQGQNALYADGHTRFLTSCRNPDCADHDIYHNEQGHVAAGRHDGDIVLGPSLARPGQ